MQTLTLEVTRDGQLDTDYYNQIAHQERVERLQTVLHSTGNVLRTFAVKTAERAGKGVLMGYAHMSDELCETNFVSELNEYWSN